MKRKLSKKVLCLCMVAVLAIGLAVPAFAAPPVTGQRVWIFNKANPQPNLNAACETVPINYTNVTMWADTGSETQRWDVQTVDASKSLYHIRSYASTVFGLNILRNGTNNCNLYPIASNSYDDCTVKCVDEGGGCYGIVLPAYVLCLTPTGFSNGSNVNWQAPTGGTNQLWYIYQNR